MGVEDLISGGGQTNGVGVVNPKSPVKIGRGGGAENKHVHVTL